MTPLDGLNFLRNFFEICKYQTRSTNTTLWKYLYVCPSGSPCIIHGWGKRWGIATTPRLILYGALFVRFSHLLTDYLIFSSNWLSIIFQPDFSLCRVFLSASSKLNSDLLRLQLVPADFNLFISFYCLVLVVWFHCREIVSFNIWITLLIVF